MPEKVSLGNLILNKTDFVSALSLLEKDKQHKALVNALKATTSNLTPINDGAKAPLTTEAVIIPGSASTAQSKTPQPTPRGSHASTKTAISLCLHPNEKSVVFSCKPVPDEFEDNWTINFLSGSSARGSQLAIPFAHSPLRKPLTLRFTIDLSSSPSSNLLLVRPT